MESSETLRQGSGRLVLRHRLSRLLAMVPAGAPIQIRRRRAAGDPLINFLPTPTHCPHTKLDWLREVSRLDQSIEGSLATDPCIFLDLTPTEYSWLHLCPLWPSLDIYRPSEDICSPSKDVT